jgi:hypothetical protein
MRHVPRPARPPLLVVAALLLAAQVWAQTPIERQGYFEVRSASTTLENDVYRLDARLQLVLSTDALEALNAGVPLTIELQTQVIRVRRFYLDEVEADLATRFELEYRPLSQRYIVRNLNSGEQSSFATLFSALNNLGRITSLPVIDAALLDPDSGYRIRVRAMLQTQQYPAPLRLLFFWRSEWHLQSEWYEWTLKQ